MANVMRIKTEPEDEDFAGGGSEICQIHEEMSASLGESLTLVDPLSTKISKQVKTWGHSFTLHVVPPTVYYDEIILIKFQVTTLVLRVKTEPLDGESTDGSRDRRPKGYRLIEGPYLPTFAEEEGARAHSGNNQESVSCRETTVVEERESESDINNPSKDEATVLTGKELAIQEEEHGRSYSSSDQGPAPDKETTLMEERESESDIYNTSKDKPTLLMDKKLAIAEEECVKAHSGVDKESLPVIETILVEERESELDINNPSKDEAMGLTDMKLAECGCSVNSHRGHANATVVTLRQCDIHQRVNPYVFQGTSALEHPFDAHPYVFQGTNALKYPFVAQSAGLVSSKEKTTIFAVTKPPVLHIPNGGSLQPGKAHFVDRPHKCSICEKVFRRPEYLKKHLKVHSRKKPYQCGSCERVFNEMSNLRKHEIVHKAHRCGDCGKAFLWYKDLRRHKLVHDSLPTDVSCNFCETAPNGCFYHKRQKVTYKEQLKETHKERQKVTNKEVRHKEPKVTQPRRYQCDYCEETFLFKRELKIHISYHTGVIPTQCDICKKVFSSACGVKRHRVIHTGERPFKCDICEKDFNRLCSLRAHGKVHERNRSTKSVKTKQHSHSNVRVKSSGV